MQLEASLLVELSSDLEEIQNQLTSIIESTPPVTDYEVIAFARYITEEARDFLAVIEGEFELITPSESRDDAKILSTAIEKARSERLVTLSLRARPENGWLASLKDAAAARSEAALLAPRTLLPDGRLLEGGIFLDSAGTPVGFGLGQQVDIWHTSEGSYHVPILGTDCLMMPKELASQLKLAEVDLRQPVEIAQLCQFAHRANIPRVVVEDAHIKIAQNRGRVGDLTGQNWSNQLEGDFIQFAADELAARESEILEGLVERNALGFVGEFKPREFQSFIEAYLTPEQS